MTKLNDLLNKDNVKVLGFDAFMALTPDAKVTDDTIYVSTLPAAQMLARGINSYYAPVIPRNTRYTTPEEIREADLDTQLYAVHETDEIKSDDPVVVVTRHQATLEVLQSMYSNVTAIITGNATVEDIKDKSVVGVLPPFLISHCARFKAYSIKDYNAATDGDLDAEQTAQRLVANNTIKVTIK